MMIKPPASFSDGLIELYQKQDLQDTDGGTAKLETKLEFG